MDKAYSRNHRKRGRMAESQIQRLRQEIESLSILLVFLIGSGSDLLTRISRNHTGEMKLELNMLKKGTLEDDTGFADCN
jgi:hypothetical protein